MRPPCPTDLVTLDVRPAITERISAPDLLLDPVGRGSSGRRTGQGFHTWKDTR
jgi:hypothetical protein